MYDHWVFFILKQEEEFLYFFADNFISHNNMLTSCELMHSLRCSFVIIPVSLDVVLALNYIFVHNIQHQQILNLTVIKDNKSKAKKPVPTALPVILQEHFTRQFNCGYSRAKVILNYGCPRYARPANSFCWLSESDLGWPLWKWMTCLSHYRPRRYLNIARGVSARLFENVVHMFLNWINKYSTSTTYKFLCKNCYMQS